MDRVLPDGEALLGDFLRAHEALLPLHGGRVGTRLTGQYPAIRLTRVGGAQAWAWEDLPEFQVDCWAVTQEDASDLVRTTVAALDDLVGTHPLGVVSGVEVTFGPYWAPDEDAQRARYVLRIRAAIFNAPIEDI